MSGSNKINDALDYDFEHNVFYWTSLNPKYSIKMFQKDLARWALKPNAPSGTPVTERAQMMAKLLS